MISKNKIKYIQLLCQKKQRDADNVFLAEGDKITKAILNQKPNLIHSIYATKNWISSNTALLNNINIIEITDAELLKISTLQTPNQVVCIIYKDNAPVAANPLKEWVLVLDGLQDPGNMGTIIRLADWYGISQIVCSHETVDCYNTKVIQSTMGSFLQVTVHYTNITEYLNKHTTVPIYGALLNGKNIKTIKPISQNGLIVIGNEGNGIGEKNIVLCNTPITIQGKGKAESLNAAIATGIILSHLVN